MNIARKRRPKNHRMKPLLIAAGLLAVVLFGWQWWQAGNPSIPRSDNDSLLSGDAQQTHVRADHRPQAGTNQITPVYDEEFDNRSSGAYGAPLPTTRRPQPNDAETLQKLLAFTGASTRTKSYRTDDSWDLLREDWLDTPENRRTIDLILSGLGVPYYCGTSITRELVRPEFTVRKFPVLSVAISIDDTERACDWLAVADRLGKLPHYIHPPREPACNWPDEPVQQANSVETPDE